MGWRCWQRSQALERGKRTRAKESERSGQLPLAKRPLIKNLPSQNPENLTFRESDEESPIYVPEDAV